MAAASAAAAAGVEAGDSAVAVVVVADGRYIILYVCFLNVADAAVSKLHESKISSHEPVISTAERRLPRSLL